MNEHSCAPTLLSSVSRALQLQKITEGQDQHARLSSTAERSDQASPVLAGHLAPSSLLQTLGSLKRQCGRKPG